MTRMLITLLTVLIFASPAMAAKPQVAWATGALTTFSPEGEYLGSYLFTGPRLVTKVAPKWFIIPGLNYEVAPRTGNHGFVGVITSEYMVTPELGIDLFSTLIQEWDSEGALSFYWGTGTGISLFMENGSVLSPWICVSGPLGSDGHAYSVGLTLVRAL